jgi:uncharacterized protein YjfI (DUF2170 family)
MEEVMGRMHAIERSLSDLVGSLSVNANLLAPSEPDGVPVMRLCIEGKEELPVYVTASPSQVLCICYLWTEDEVKADKRADMLEAMMDLNIAIPLSNFGRIGGHYVIYGALAADASPESIAIDVAMAADNAVEALEVFNEFLN